MMTDRERDLIASTQDRMLRDADGIAFSDDERECGTCGSFDRRPHLASDGELYEELSAVGICGQLDIICDDEAPACRWWSK